jgi:hypothetical protein
MKVKLTKLVDGDNSHFVPDVVLRIEGAGGDFTGHHALGRGEEGTPSDATVRGNAVA